MQALGHWGLLLVCIASLHCLHDCPQVLHLLDGLLVSVFKLTVNGRLLVQLRLQLIVYIDLLVYLLLEHRCGCGHTLEHVRDVF